MGLALQIGGSVTIRSTVRWGIDYGLFGECEGAKASENYVGVKAGMQVPWFLFGLSSSYLQRRPE